MRMVIQRVKHASVTVDGEITGKIGQGFLVLLGIGPDDTEEIVEKMADKMMRLRIFSDENDKINRSLSDVDGELLLVSQFTLYGNCRKGRRPEFLSAARPEIGLTTDIIVGFPGETEDDFARTCKLVERCGFMRLHVFRYSKRPGTPAAIRDDQVDPKVKAARSQTLIELGRRLTLSDMERRLGTIEEVVIERPGIATSES